MEQLAIEKLISPRSPRRYSASFYYPETGNNSGASTPFMSAPASPRGGSGGRCYYSLPPSPPHRSGGSEEEDHNRAAVPFSWEDSPGTPKRLAGGMKNSVDHLTAMGFQFSSAPVSPQREFDFMDGYKMNPSQNVLEDDQFEFSSARMSDAESVASVAMSHADELFFQGQILPLKLPPRLQQKSSISLNLQVQELVSSDSFSCTPRVRAGSSFVHQVHSPRSQRLPGHGISSQPRSPRAKSPSKLARAGDFPGENKHPFTSNNRSSVNSSTTSSVRRSLKELLHLNASNNGGSSGSSRSNSSGLDSRKSSRSSSGSSTSQRFSNSRSSSASSNRSMGSARSSFSSKQVSPVPHELLQSYNNNRKFKAEELRKRTFLPYKQGLLGCLGCISFESFREIHDHACMLSLFFFALASRNQAIKYCQPVAYSATFRLRNQHPTLVQSAYQNVIRISKAKISGAPGAEKLSPRAKCGSGIFFLMVQAQRRSIETGPGIQIRSPTSKAKENLSRKNPRTSLKSSTFCNHI